MDFGSMVLFVLNIFPYFVQAISNLLCFLTTVLWICMFFTHRKNDVSCCLGLAAGIDFCMDYGMDFATKLAPKICPWGHHVRPKGNQNRWPRTPGNLLEPTWARLGAENAPGMHFRRSWCRFVWFGRFSVIFDGLLMLLFIFTRSLYFSKKNQRHTTCKPTRNMPTDHKSTILTPWPGGMPANIE